MLTAKQKFRPFLIEKTEVLAERRNGGSRRKAEGEPLLSGLFRKKEIYLGRGSNVPQCVFGGNKTGEKAQEKMNTQQKQWEAAQAKVEGIAHSSDPQIRYRDERPIVTIRQMFDSSVEEFSERTAFYVKDQPGGPYRGITYREAGQDVHELGTGLLRLGLQGKHIALVGESRYEWAAAYLAITGGVGVAVPIDKELPSGELVQLIRMAKAEAVVFSRKYKDIFLEAMESGDTSLRLLICMDEGDDKILSFRQITEQGKQLLSQGDQSFQRAGDEIDPKAMAILLFTSGTTGIAKGVMLSQENICEDLMSMVTLIHIKKEDIFFSVLPIHHTYECTCGFLCPIYRGAGIAYCEGLRYIVKNLAEARPTVLLAVPMLLESFYKKIWGQAKKSGMEKKMRLVLKINRYTKKIGLDLVPKLLHRVTDTFGGRMRLMISGGAAIAPEVIRGIQEFGIIALQGYGLTECGPIAALNPDIDGKPDSAGRSIPDVLLRIDGADQEGIGEICVKGKNVMLGYYKDQEATDEVIRDGWFHTGDLGRMDQDGFLFITGRKKNVIITKNGKNVFPEEIEYYLSKIPYVEESMVYGAESTAGKAANAGNPVNTANAGNSANAGNTSSAGNAADTANASNSAKAGNAANLAGAGKAAASSRAAGEMGETLLFAAIRADQEAVAEKLGPDFTSEQVEALLWQEIDALNATLPYFKRIKKISVREDAFEKNTAQKIKRFAVENKK